MIYTVFSVDDSFYLQWQTDLLAYSYQKVGQPGALVRLWSSNKPPTPFVGQTFQTQPYSPHPKTGDVFPIYNKPAAVAAWLEQNRTVEEDTILLIDPDCIFLVPCTMSVPRGTPVAQPYWYMDPFNNMNTKLIHHYGFDPQDIQEIGIPVVIHAADLRELAPLWLRYTEMIREDLASGEFPTVPWWSDMWGYVFAAASLGLRHRVEPLAHLPKRNQEDLPLVHYCEPITDHDTGWKWSKRSYQPWAHVPVAPAGTPPATNALINLVNEYAARQGNLLLPPPAEEMGIMVNGSLSKEAVTETITEIFPDLQQCVEEFGSECSGLGTFLLIVTPDGAVETATLQLCTEGFEGACSGFAPFRIIVTPDGTVETAIPACDRYVSTSSGERKPEGFVPQMLERLQNVQFPISSGKTVVVLSMTIDEDDN